MFAKRVSTAMKRRDGFLHPRRREQIDRILEGIVGMQLRKLLVPVLLLHLKKRRRSLTVILRSQMTTGATTSVMTDFCMLHPFLAPLGREAILMLINSARRMCYFPDDVVLCPREPPRSFGIVICTTGKLLMRSTVQTDVGVDMISRLRVLSSTSTASAIYAGDFIGVAEEGETLLSTPTILGTIRTMTDMSNPHLVVAQTTVDAFLISYELIHRVVAGRGQQSASGLFARTPGGSTSPNSVGINTPRITELGVLSPAARCATPKTPRPPQSLLVLDSSAAKEHRPVCALPDPTLILIPRTLTVQSQYRMSYFYLLQSWLLNGIPKENFGEIISKLECRCFAPGEVIVERGKYGAGVFFLRRGTAEIVGAAPIAAASSSNVSTTGWPKGLDPFANGSSMDRLVGVVPAGSVIGERSAVFHDRSKDTIAARTFCDTWVLPQAEVDRLRSNKTINSALNSSGVAVATRWLRNLRNEENSLKHHDEEMTRQKELVRRFNGNPPTTGSSPPRNSAAGLQISPHRSPLRSTRREMGVHRYSPPTAALLSMQHVMLTVRMIEALRTVRYLRDAPDECLLALANIAEPKVFMPHTALTSTSAWCNTLYIVTKGAATVQHGLRNRPSPEDYPWSYPAGSCVGMECVIEHRTMFPTCSVTMVEAWSIKRELLRTVLQSYNLVELAEREVEFVLADLQQLLAQNVERRLMPNTANGPSSSKVSRRRGGSPSRDSSDRIQDEEESDEGDTAPSVVAPTAANDESKAPKEDATATDNRLLPFNGRSFVVELSNADINRGIAGHQTALLFLSRVETSRHERYSLMFSEAIELITHRSIEEAQRRKDLDRHTERYRELAEQYLAVESSADASRQVSSYHSNAESIANSVTQSFVEVNEKADEVRQQLLAEVLQERQKLETSRGSGGSDSDDSNSSSDLFGHPYTRKNTTRQQRSSSLFFHGVMHTHVTPYLYFVVESSEFVGDRSPWMLQLLQRYGGVWGYLERSFPERGSMVPLYNSRGSLVMENMFTRGAQHRESLTHTPPGRKATMDQAVRYSFATRNGSTFDAEEEHMPQALGASRRSLTTVSPPTPSRRKSKQKNDVPLITRYKPTNPHGYNVILPESVQPTTPPENLTQPSQQQGRQPSATGEMIVGPLSQLRSGRHVLMARSIVTRMFPGTKRKSRVNFQLGDENDEYDMGGTDTMMSGVAVNKDDDYYNNDLIGKVLLNGQQLHEEQQKVRALGPKGGPGRRRASFQETLESSETQLKDINFFDDEWSMMMRGEGVYNDGMRILHRPIAKKKSNRALAYENNRRMSLNQARNALLAVSKGKKRRPSGIVLGNSMSMQDPAFSDSGSPTGGSPRLPLQQGSSENSVVAMEWSASGGPSTPQSMGPSATGGPRRSFVAMRQGPPPPPLSTPFLDEWRSYLQKSASRVETEAKKALDTSGDNNVHNPLAPNSPVDEGIGRLSASSSAVGFGGWKGSVPKLSPSRTPPSSQTPHVTPTHPPPLLHPHPEPAHAAECPMMVVLKSKSGAALRRPMTATRSALLVPAPPTQSPGKASSSTASSPRRPTVDAFGPSTKPQFVIPAVEASEADKPPLTPRTVTSKQGSPSASYR